MYASIARCLKNCRSPLHDCANDFNTCIDCTDRNDIRGTFRRNDASESSDQDGDGIGDNADDDDDGDGLPDDPVDPVDNGDSGGILPGFTAVTSLASVLGAAILVAGRRKD